MPFKPLKVLLDKLAGRAAPKAPPRGDGGVRGFGDLWGALQEIARQESPERFADMPVAQHAAESLEGKKDVERWIEILRRRRDPAHGYRFPEHHVRHRGQCLIPRHWPNGTLWEAFDDETLFRAPVEPQRTRDELAAAIDAWLQTRA